MRVIPHLAQQVTPAQHLARVADEFEQQTQLGRGEVDLPAGQAHLERAAVDHEVAEGDPVGGGELQAAQHRSDARVQHPGLHRFDDIVVGPGLQSDDHVEIVAARREQDDRQ